MSYEDLEGKRLALLITDYTDDKGVYVLSGIVTRQENDFVLIYDNESKPFPLLREWEERLQTVKSEVHDIFDANLFIPLTLGKRLTSS